MKFEVCAFTSYQQYAENLDADTFCHFDSLEEALNAARSYANSVNHNGAGYKYELVLTYRRVGSDYDYLDPIPEGTHSNSYEISKEELLRQSRTE